MNSKKNQIDASETNRKLLQNEDKCDKYDYIAAVACGAIGGMIDIFLVGAPRESTLAEWTDQQVDKAVMAFSRKMGWNPKEKNINNVKSAIGFLERNSKVNYDQRKPGDVNDLFNISPKTHHMMSLAHSPDIVGLFFSILNQFTSTSTFIANGKLVTVSTDTFELQGGNFVMRIMCGISNWIVHLMSDIAGSSGAHNRGTGIVMPFYEFFGYCRIGNFNYKNEKKNLAEIAQLAFTQGYDLRFGMTQAIPVVVTELIIRLVWALRRYIQYHKTIKECVPSNKNADLRVMLLIGNGTLCIMDGVDAGIRSGGNFVTFFMRMNLCAWVRFATLVLKEVCIRVGLSNALQRQLDAYQRINELLVQYLNQLKQIDLELYKREIQEFEKVVTIFAQADSERELNNLLIEKFEEMGIKKPWEGDFNEHMSNKQGRLVFE